MPKTLHKMLGVSSALEKALLDALPPGAEKLFKVRRAGNRLGLSIACPHCDYKPPQTLSGYQKWRNLTAHVAMHRPRILK